MTSFAIVRSKSYLICETHHLLLDSNSVAPYIDIFIALCVEQIAPNDDKLGAIILSQILRIEQLKHWSMSLTFLLHLWSEKCGKIALFIELNCTHFLDKWQCDVRSYFIFWKLYTLLLQSNDVAPYMTFYFTLYGTNCPNERIFRVSLTMGIFISSTTQFHACTIDIFRLLPGTLSQKPLNDFAFNCPSFHWNAIAPNRDAKEQDYGIKKRIKSSLLIEFVFVPRYKFR